MISYAQNCEDVLINRLFVDDQVQQYVDVGAGHPTLHSVTKHFYDSGWSGINFEPRSYLAEQYGAKRVRDTTLCMAVSNEATTLPFFEVRVATDTSGDNGGLSTLDPKLAEQYREKGYQVLEREVRADTLSQLLEDHGVTEIGFLKVDVEGHEFEVVDGMDWQRWRPRLVILECTIPSSSQSSGSKAPDIVLQNGYQRVFFDGLNQFFLRQEDAQMAERFALPVNIFDDYVTSREFDLRNEVEQATARISLLEKRLSEGGPKLRTRRPSINGAKMLKEWMAVAVGGMLGATARHALYWVVGHIHPNLLVLATLLANVVGCFLIGILVQWSFQMELTTKWYVVGLRVGFLGGLTTFSAFSLDLVRLWSEKSAPMAVTLAASHILLGIAAVLAGMACVREAGVDGEA